MKCYVWNKRSSIVIFLLAMASFATIGSLCLQKCKEKESETVREQDIETRRDLLCSVREDMTEDNVIQILGKPDEIKTNGANARYSWIYGVKKKGEFPLIGSVIFKPNRKAYTISCPTRPTILTSSNILVPFSESPQKTLSGMYCKIEKVFQKPGFNDSHYIRVSLVNTGDNKFLYPHDNTGMRFSLILEIYDCDKNLLLREPLIAYHSPCFFDRLNWPVLTIPPRAKESEDVPIWWRDFSNGILAPGTYYVRVAFPFEEGRYYGSNLTEWKLLNGLNSEALVTSNIN